MRKLAWILLVALIAIQFYRPERNLSDDQLMSVEKTYEVPNDVKQILSVACNDCHSNLTRYPWYANIQPVAFFLNQHVTEGKRKLNFSEFSSYPLARQFHKLEEVVELTEKKEMPLKSYTALGLHADAKLTDDQRKVIINWANAQIDSLKAKYPPDSLVRKRK